MIGPSWIHHDPFCPACGADDCTCGCLCDLIADVRDDERRVLRPYMRTPGHAEAAENRP